jgi:signal transduction histidine kinase
LFFMRRILRPIQALARAADSVSRGEQIAPLPVRGPSEARDVTASFNLMQARLSRYVDDRTYMLAAISHDLRTPITSLRLRAELIDDAALRAIIRSTLEEMAQMVSATLNFASDDARSEHTSECDLALLLGKIVADQALQGRAVHLSGATTLPYRCRPGTLRRALINLIDNAVRYGKSAHIRLSAAPAGQAAAGAVAGAGARIDIDDNGPGIPSALMGDVFKPFFRLDPARSRRSGATGGTGLGLAIARSCIEAHGGRLTLCNRDSGGLRATVVLPN